MAHEGVAHDRATGARDWSPYENSNGSFYKEMCRFRTSAYLNKFRIRVELRKANYGDEIKCQDLVESYS